uniref:'chromo' domain containing protein n=1 Tax=Solanum tuberosum TaxID=4113 RepID=M1DXF2_SOLTU
MGGLEILYLALCSVQAAMARFSATRAGRCSETKNKRKESEKGRIKFLRELKLGSRSGDAFLHTNWDRLPRTGINIGTGVTIRHANLERVPRILQAAIDRPGLEDQKSSSSSRIVNTRFNGVRPVVPVNAPAEESTTRGRGRGKALCSVQAATAGFCAARAGRCSGFDGWLGYNA